ncbi:MAG: hypothetical protein ABW214_06170, partial [Terrimicrobiaceae bacterium]
SGKTKTHGRRRGSLDKTPDGCAIKRKAVRGCCSKHPLQNRVESSAVILPVLSFLYRADFLVFVSH